MIDSYIMRFRRPQDIDSHARRRLLAGVLVLGLLAACGPSSGPEGSPEDQAHIEEALRAYLPRLADAYATGNVAQLEAVAVPKEAARVRLRFSEFEDKGRILRPEFHEMTVEKIHLWNYSNAVVTTLEVWTLRSFAIGSETVLSEAVNQRSRVKYQLKRKDHGWVVLYRELAETLDS